MLPPIPADPLAASHLDNFAEACLDRWNLVIFTLDWPPTGVFTSSASILDNSPLALLNNSSELRCSNVEKLLCIRPVLVWIVECNFLRFQHVLSHIDPDWLSME
jgi:hypothetical protein